MLFESGDDVLSECPTAGRIVANGRAADSNEADGQSAEGKCPDGESPHAGQQANGASAQCNSAYGNSSECQYSSGDSTYCQNSGGDITDGDDASRMPTKLSQNRIWAHRDVIQRKSHQARCGTHSNTPPSDSTLKASNLILQCINAFL